MASPVHASADEETSGGEASTLLKKSATFSASARVAPVQTPQTPITFESLLAKVVGPAAPSTNRVSESLDYEPVQNRVFYHRLKMKKDGKKNIWG